jgi:hypothetical protein
MIPEYVLLLAMSVLFVISVVFKGPHDAFTNAGPKLAARVERNLITGDRFSENLSTPSTLWKER